MVTTRQRRQIKEHMANIKRARANELGEREIKRRTNELYVYLQKEGIIDTFDE